MSLGDRGYTVAQIDEIIGVSRSTVHRALAEGHRAGLLVTALNRSRVLMLALQPCPRRDGLS